ncbi:Beta-1,4-galactosyltransferase [Operophtera brumata]|uniref:Beta-1,4-galactosyltransferase n=1 Tax=Operophtera brumata TaxID=104452 RepID=A0A0L7KWY7_OPEBR|nr:Beta-1,4-galactosyltransferase [Operophtera brumata]
MRADQYVMVNGFSNRFEGWGGEDDDLFRRTRSRYSMLVHPPVSHNAARYRILAENCLAVVRGDAAGDGYGAAKSKHQYVIGTLYYFQHPEV